MKNIFLFLALIAGCASSRPVISPPVHVDSTTTFLIDTVITDTVRDTLVIVNNDTLVIRDTIVNNSTITIIDTVLMPCADTSVINLRAVGNLKADGHSDDYPALQRVIDSCIAIGKTNFFLPAGNYAISKGLLFARKDGNFLVSATLHGQGNGYDNTPSQTVITCLNGQGWAVAVHRGKGCEFDHLLILGHNTGVGDYSVARVFMDTSATFVTNGCRDDRYSPHAGIVVDPFGDASIPMADRYQDFTANYVNAGGGGSTDIQIRDVRCRYFVVDFLLSPHTQPQNGEIIHIVDCWGDNAKVAVAVGEAQARSIEIDNFHDWGPCLTIFDMVNYGGGAGCPPKVVGLNAAGANRYLCQLNTWVSEGLNISRSHIESMWSLGGSTDPTAGNLTFEDSWVALVGSLPYTFYGAPIAQPKTVFSGGYLKVINSFLWEYGTLYALPLAITCPNAIFDKATLNFIPWNNYGLAVPSYTNCATSLYPFGDNKLIGTQGSVAAMQATTPLFIEGMQYFSRGGRLRTRVNNPNSGISGISSIPLNAAYSLTSLDMLNLISTMTVPPGSADYKNIIKGDALLYHDVDEFGKPGTFALGLVTKKVDSSGVITIAGRGSQLKTGTPYSLTIYRNEVLIGVLILGQTTVGSNVVTNVQTEANAVFSTTDVPVYMQQFPNGTTITGFGAGTITMSQPALFTDSNAAVVSSDWHGMEAGTLNLSNAQHLGYKKGDMILNNRPDLFLGITYWLCTRSGITGTANLPTFQTY